MKLFVLTSRVPWPLEKGDKLRIYHQIRALSEHHEIYLCCLSDTKTKDGAVEELEKHCEQVNIYHLPRVKVALSLAVGFFSSKPYQVHYFFQKSIRRKVRQLLDDIEPDHIYCQLIRVTEYVKHYHKVPKTLDYMDAFNRGLLRRVGLSPWYKKWLMKEESKRLLAYENLIFDYFEHHTIISNQDQQYIYHPDREKIKVVPNGVDDEFFQPIEREKEFDLVFTGNMNYPPNIDSAIFLAKEILPAVQKQYPDCKLLIAGVDPAPSVRALENSSKGTKVTGWLPDIRDAYASARIFIAPMNIGTGLQNKLLEAMCMKLPCITSELANNALGAEHGKQILIGRDTEEYVSHIFHLLKDQEFRNDIAEQGRDYVRQNFNWEHATAKLNDLICSNSESQ
jgi:sugar transferase (PEP-CTERM/EpsH1 system associated)